LFLFSLKNYPIIFNKLIYIFSPTVCVTGAGAGVDSVWEQKKLEARKMLENAADSPASSARFVGTLLTLKIRLIIPE